ncbi:MAG: DUF4132 domain-containing protein [Prevotella sp.]|nr:DUF4132 domain-containing protein [Prevotella sp.]
MKTKEDLLAHCRQYVDSISLWQCNIWEKTIVAYCKENDYSLDTYNDIPTKLEDQKRFTLLNVSQFLLAGGHLPHILPKEYAQLLEIYIKGIGNLSDTKGLFRIDVREKKTVEGNTSRLSAIYRSFFAAAAYGLTIDELVRGQIPDMGGGYFHVSYAPVLTAAILHGDTKAIEAVKQVLTSENNVGILTHDLITAIECNSNEELHSLLLDVLRAAKLQEGLRQSIVECGNEYNLTFYKRLLDVIAEENMLRYSSVRRSVQTWAGLGYAAVTDKDIKTIFEGIRRFLFHPEERTKAYVSDNALHVYLALYSAGSEDFTVAQHDALQLIDSEAPLQNRIAAIYYLDRSDHFEVTKHLSFFAQHLDDKFLLAFLVQQLHTEAWAEKVCYGTVKPVTGEKQRLFLTLFNHIFARQKEIKAKEVFKFKGFEWFSIQLERCNYVNALWFFASHLKTSESINDLLTMKLPTGEISFLCDYTYIDKEHSKPPVNSFMRHYYPLGSAEARRQFLIRTIFNSKDKVFNLLLSYFHSETFTEAEVKEIEKKLQSKVSDTRNKAVQALLTLPYTQLHAAYGRLLTTKGDHITAALTELREGNTQLTKDFAITAGASLAIEPIDYPGAEEGYGLYKVGTIPDIRPYNPFESSAEKKSLIGKLIGKVTGSNRADASLVFSYTYEELHKLYADLEKIIIDNADKEYKPHWGEAMTLGEKEFLHVGSEYSLDCLPYPELWKGFVADHPIKDEDLLGIDIMLRHIDNAHFYTLIELEADNNPFGRHDMCGKWKYAGHFKVIIEDLLTEVQKRNPTALFNAAYNLLALFYFYCPSNKFKNIYSKYTPSEGGIFGHYAFTGARSYAEACWQSETEKTRLTELLIAMYPKYVVNGDDDTPYWADRFFPNLLLLSDYNLQDRISDNAVMEILLNKDGYALRQECHAIYSHRANRLTIVYEKEEERDPRLNKEVYDNLRRFIDRIAQHLFKIELTRRNAPTVVSGLISHIGTAMTLQGSDYLIKAMQALGKDHLVAGGYGTEKRTVLTEIIRSSFPLPSDTPNSLSRISSDRLLELAYFAPQWQALVKAYLGWEGFDLAYYYFIAHTKEMSYDEKRAATVLYTDLAPEDLTDGAFDERLFHEAYTTVGEKRFDLFYKAARYIGNSNFHSRARRFADTALGKISEDTITEQILTKRNKDALCSLGLLPDRSDEALQCRYQLIQRFLKDSKQYGAQRQASEKRACEIALLNLSRGAGYADPIQLTWRMESLQVAENAEYLNGISVEDYTLSLNIAADGTNRLSIRQGEKKLKSVPTKIKKHPDYLRIATMGREWTQQYRRARAMMEDMMIRQTPLRPQDAEVIAHNPIVSPMFRQLLLSQGSTIGFYTDEGLETLSGIKAMDSSAPLTITHACQLYNDHSWSAWQHFVFSRKMVQPFKQVFREIYVPTPDEAGSYESRRYSGYQIQVRQTAAALRSRGWTADYESGLRKVFYRQGIAVELYAEADWFSPADVEAPAIEYVSFYPTRSHEHLKIEDIDPILYSEVMRDVDMAVSIAFVGGVDPETHNSTKELRAVIAECTAELLKLSNVTISDNFIHIRGTLANYTVHLGSGIVRQVGGMEIPIVPVHSQHRGKLYLPFMDEDPKTVEIISKMVLLAEDNKLKDPTILQAIKRNL